ncbi:MAG: hypothetical protein DME22_20100 [Verrucomicrobia bacterium]|nr:MAG: hypothetical protein DME22_20100 [Verrucomicrobiota bacterium]
MADCGGKMENGALTSRPVAAQFVDARLSMNRPFVLLLVLDSSPLGFEDEDEDERENDCPTLTPLLRRGWGWVHGPNS